MQDASLQVCKFTKLKTLEITNCKFASMQVWKYATLQVCNFANLKFYKIKKSRNY